MIMFRSYGTEIVNEVLNKLTVDRAERNEDCFPKLKLSSSFE